MSQQQMQSALDAIAARLKKQDPTGDGGFGSTVLLVSDFLSGNLKPILMMLMGAVGFVLLIACSNVANLLLARRTTRQREISIRAALGASRVRMIRQLLTESILLSVIGGVLGIALAWVAVKLLQQTPSATIPSAKEITLDPMVLSFTAGLCCIAGILFGIAPAWEGSKSNVSETLKEGARGSSGSLGKHRVVLIVAETALASMLFIGAGLSLRSLWSIQTVDPGFNPQDVLTFHLAAPAQFTGDRIPLFYEQVLDRLRAVPSIQSVVLARNLPMSGTDPSMAISIEGTPPPPSQIPVVTRFRAIGPGYFRGLQTRVLSGREFTEHDTGVAPKVAIVSESLAKLYWPNENAIGKRLKPEMPGGDWCVVIGVAADVRHWAADISDVEPTAYYPYTQVPVGYLPLLEGNMTYAVRSQNPKSVLPLIRAAVGEVDKTTPVYLVQSMDQMVADSGSLRRFDMWLFGAFAGLALVLAAIGIYGVMAYSVSQRTREIGIRMAMGAQRGNVLALILRQGAIVALVGVALGLIGALALAQVMASIVFGISTRDIATFSIVPWIVFAMILIGCYIPARRAAKVDPIVALRYE
jgi:putative ABC transport system permease protein